MNKYLKTKEGSLEDLAKQMQNKVLESDYQDKFKKELDKAGKPIGQMTGAEKKAFFNKIDKMHTAKNEQAKEPYAIGMAAAMKAKNDQPPLKKSTITKAHDIAKSIEKDQKESVEIKEANITLHDHDSTDKDFKDLVRKSNLTMKVKRGYKGDNVTLSGNPMNIEKMLKTMYGNDWNKTYKRRGNEYIEAEYKKEEVEEQKDSDITMDTLKPGVTFKEQRFEVTTDIYFKNARNVVKGAKIVVGAKNREDAEEKASDAINNARMNGRWTKPETGGNFSIDYLDNVRVTPTNKPHGIYSKGKEYLGAEYVPEEVSQKEIDKFHTSLDKLVHKSFGHSSDEKKKEMKKEEKDIPKGYHKMPDGTIMKDSEHKKEEVKETHSFVTNKQNEKQKEVGGEKEPIKTTKNEWKTFAMMAAELREKKEEKKEDKKEMQAGDDTRDKKVKTMTGEIATTPEMNPKVDYKY